MSCRDDNNRFVREQERKVEVNAAIVQILSNLQRQKQHELGSSHKVRQRSPAQGRQEERIDGVYGSRPKKRH